MKICVLLIFLILPWISRVGDWALKWTEGNERLQIVFVMMLFPLTMNIVQYYIIDSFIKKKEVDHERVPQDGGDDRDPFDDTIVDDSDDDSTSGESSDSVRMLRPGKSAVTRKSGGNKNNNGNGHEEYNPELDGQTVVESSRSEEDRAKLLKELVPHE